jgi:hypothetical protein
VAAVWDLSLYDLHVPAQRSDGVPMTLPSERRRSLLYARQFLLELIDPTKTPRVPKAVRQQALRVLRHYPYKFEIENLPERADQLFGVDTQ